MCVGVCVVMGRGVVCTCGGREGYQIYVCAWVCMCVVLGGWVGDIYCSNPKYHTQEQNPKHTV